MKDRQSLSPIIDQEVADFLTYPNKPYIYPVLQLWSRRSRGPVKISYPRKKEGRWILLLKNTFGILEVQKKLKDNVIKIIGDEIMFFIPDEILYTEGDTIIDNYTLLEETFAVIDILKILHVDELR